MIYGIPSFIVTWVYIILYFCMQVYTFKEGTPPDLLPTYALSSHSQ
jgi:hypothetical protein